MCGFSTSKIFDIMNIIKVSDLVYFDDAPVVTACWKLVDTDVEEYVA